MWNYATQQNDLHFKLLLSWYCHPYNLNYILRFKWRNARGHSFRLCSSYVRHNLLLYVIRNNDDNCPLFAFDTSVLNLDNLDSHNNVIQTLFWERNFKNFTYFSESFVWIFWTKWGLRLSSFLKCEINFAVDVLCQNVWTKIKKITFKVIL